MEGGNDLARLHLSSGSGREERMLLLLITGSPALHPHLCLVLRCSVVSDSP